MINDLLVQLNDALRRVGRLEAKELSVRALNRTAVTTNYSITTDDVYIGVNNGATAVTITLPNTNSVPAGRVYMVKDEIGFAATKNITLACSGGQTIDGTATKVINVAFDNLWVISDGANWFTI